MISTSGMAEDVVVLLDFIGWTGHRELHVVGISMGGMISQGEFVCESTRSDSLTMIPELALKIPHRIASLSLLSTKAGVRFTAMNLAPVRYQRLHVHLVLTSCTQWTGMLTLLR